MEQGEVRASCDDIANENLFIISICEREEKEEPHHHYLCSSASESPCHYYQNRGKQQQYQRRKRTEKIGCGPLSPDFSGAPTLPKVPVPGSSPKVEIGKDEGT